MIFCHVVPRGAGWKRDPSNISDNNSGDFIKVRIVPKRAEKKKCSQLEIWK